MQTPPSVDVLGEPHDALSEPGEHRATNYGTADLVINGALVETKLLIYGKVNVSNIYGINSIKIVIIPSYENCLFLARKLHSVELICYRNI